MDKFKEEIAKKIVQVIELDEKEIESYIERPKESSNGDYAFPCFRLAKELKKAPPMIAKDISENIQIEGTDIKKVEVVGGYLNFFIDKGEFAKQVLANFSNQGEYGSSQKGKGKNVVIDYSAPNIAKPFHIGHLRTTVIGGALYNIYKYLGYNTIGINYLGDYGTQFGKLIEGYKLWGEEYNLDENPISELMKIYIRINNLCKEDEQVLERCRENFKKLEQGDKYCVDLWEKFRELSIKEFKKIYDLLGSKFDSWDGESFIATKADEIPKILEKAGKLQDSNGAKIVDLEDEGIDTPCMIQKSNGSTIYATRDLAAILYRARTYDFDKCLYVVAYEQNLHFKQIFTVAKYLGLDEKYVKGLEHVAFGMVSLPTGKMSTRSGNIVKIEDLLNEAIQRAGETINKKNPNLENKEEIAKKVGIGAVIFNNLSSSRVKDIIFDWDTALNFQGETGPYIQYTYVRTQSVMNKLDTIPEIAEINFEKLEDDYSQEILKLIYRFDETLEQVTQKEEPAILTRYLLDLAKAFSSFYNENKIIGEEEETQNARVYLTRAVGEVLKIGAKLLGIEMPEKM